MGSDEKRVFGTFTELVEVKILPVSGRPSEVIELLPAVVGNEGSRLELLDGKTS